MRAEIYLPGVQQPRPWCRHIRATRLTHLHIHIQPLRILLFPILVTGTFYSAWGARPRSTRRPARHAHARLFPAISISRSAPRRDAFVSLAWRPMHRTSLVASLFVVAGVSHLSCHLPAVCDVFACARQFTSQIRFIATSIPPHQLWLPFRLPRSCNMT